MLKLSAFQFKCCAVASVGVVGLIAAAMLNGYHHRPYMPLPPIRTAILCATLTAGIYVALNAAKYSKTTTGRGAFFLLALFYTVLGLSFVWKAFLK